MTTIKSPRPNTLWKNKKKTNNGDAVYRVLFLTNHTNPHPEHPIQVIYENPGNGTKWSLELRKWYGHMQQRKMPESKPPGIEVSKHLPINHRSDTMSGA